MSYKIDKTIVRIMREVSKEIGEKYNVTLSERQLLDVLYKKHEAIKKAVKNNRPVRDIYLGLLESKDSKEYFYTEKKKAMQEGMSANEAHKVALEKLDIKIKKVIGLTFNAEAKTN